MPPHFGTFLMMVNELDKRDGENVRECFKRVLVANRLAADEKRVVRRCLRKVNGPDVPFTLPATDPTQRREYLLRFVPAKRRAITVSKGDNLERIARAVYPKLSRWSALDLLVFINELPNADLIREGSTLYAYDYEIVNDQQASWVKAGQ